MDRVKVEQRSKQNIVIHTNMARLAQYPFNNEEINKTDACLWNLNSSHQVSNDNTGVVVERLDVVDDHEIQSDEEDADHVAEDDLAVHVVEVGDHDVDQEGDYQEHLTHGAETGEDDLINILTNRSLESLFKQNKSKSWNYIDAWL